MARTCISMILKLDHAIWNLKNLALNVSLTLYLIITPLKDRICEDIMENGAFAKSKCSIFHNIFNGIQNLFKIFLGFFQCCLKIDDL